jgi:hypothetical protein
MIRYLYCCVSNISIAFTFQLLKVLVQLAVIYYHPVLAQVTEYLYCQIELQT